MLYLKYMACSYIFYSLLGWFFFEQMIKMIKSIRHFHGGNKHINHLPIHCDLLGGMVNWLPTTGAQRGREIQVAPFSQGAWSHFETDPFKILADWCGRAWEFLENTQSAWFAIVKMKRYSNDQFLRIKFGRQLLGNYILCWNLLKKISGQGISSFEKSGEVQRFQVVIFIIQGFSPNDDRWPDPLIIHGSVENGYISKYEFPFVI